LPPDRTPDRRYACSTAENGFEFTTQDSGVSVDLVDPPPSVLDARQPAHQ
jgi:hypothetical protein